MEAARTALECSIIGMQMACAEPACISRARRDILRGGGFWMAGGRGFLFFLHASLFDARFDLSFRVLEKNFWIRSIFFFFFFGKIALR